MSRICVKNLPRKVAEDRLLSLFSPAGEIAEVQVKRANNGQSRGYAFIRFRTKTAAKRAIMRFDKFELDSRRIICEMAYEIGGPSRAKTDRLFVGNLPFQTSERELRSRFCKFGEVRDVHIVMDKQTLQSRGFGFIQYARPESAARALLELNRSIFQGRTMRVQEALPKVASKKLGKLQAWQTSKPQRQEPGR